MTPSQRFWIGGGGALLPVIATLLAVDLGSMIDHYKDYTLGAYLGTAIRYALLFILGGVVASLNYDEVQPIKLVQLGIAAPALVASYVNAAQAQRTASIAPTAQISRHLPGALSFVSAAQAEGLPKAPVVLAGGFFSDFISGIQGPAAIQRNAAANTTPTSTVEFERQNSELNAKILDLSVAAQKSAAAAEVALRKAREDAAAVAAAAGEKLTPELTAAARQSASAAEAAASYAAKDANAVQAAAAALHRLGSSGSQTTR